MYDLRGHQSIAMVSTATGFEFGLELSAKDGGARLGKGKGNVMLLSLWAPIDDNGEYDIRF